MNQHWGISGSFLSYKFHLHILFHRLKWMMWKSVSSLDMMYSLNPLEQEGVIRTSVEVDGLEMAK